MKHLLRIFIFSIAFAVAATGFVLPNKPAWSQSAVEKLYADLAKLPTPEREKRLEEGARKEGALALVKTIRGKLGRGH